MSTKTGHMNRKKHKVLKRLVFHVKQSHLRENRRRCYFEDEVSNLLILNVFHVKHWISIIAHVLQARIKNLKQSILQGKTGL